MPRDVGCGQKTEPTPRLQLAYVPLRLSYVYASLRIKATFIAPLLAESYGDEGINNYTQPARPRQKLIGLSQKRKGEIEIATAILRR